MNRFKQLEQKKILKELEYIETDYEYKNGIITEIDPEFIGDVNEYLKSNPQLKDVYDKKMGEKFDKVFNEKTKPTNTGDTNNEDNIQEVDMDQVETNINNDISEETTPEPKKEKSPKVKKLYRDIVKLTHPDKVKVKHLNDLYLKATQYYEQNDMIGLYAICNELNIEYELEEADNEFIIAKIKQLKNKIGFLESTFTWKWYSAKEEEKEQLILTYINLQLNS